MCSHSLETAPVTGAQLAGAVLPDLPRALELALEVQQLLPSHGVLGIDIALTDEGPMLNEVNGNPHHSLYQRASARGLLNPDFRPLIDEALAVTEAMRQDAGLGHRWLRRR